MDDVSEVLRSVQLSGAAFVDARFTAPWSCRVPPADGAAGALGRRGDRVMLLHLVTEGECWIEVDGDGRRRLSAGHVVVLPHGEPHRMASDLALASGSGAQLPGLLARRPPPVVLGGGGAVTRVVCGYLTCASHVARRLVAGLPRLLCVDLHGSTTAAWLEASIPFALDRTHASRAGGDSVLARLAETLLIEILRLHVEQSTREPTHAGWLAALRDPTVGAALAAMHRDVAHDWTLEELARISGTSRSVLAERFRERVGCPPFEYLTRWRMLHAAHMMRTSSAALSRIAEVVGYSTDAAFSRAFRREFGMSPARWRRHQAGGERTAPAPPRRRPHAVSMS